MTRLVFVASFCAAAACGGSSSSNPDAKVFKDGASGNKVVAVSCTGITPAATITASSSADEFDPATATINVGQVVQITTPSIHNVMPGHQPSDSSIADPGLTEGTSSTTCFMFTASGTYGFHCAFHSMMNGTVTVN